MSDETKYEPIDWGEGLSNSYSSLTDTENLYNQNSVLPDNYSVSELKRDEQFGNVAERFLKSVGRNEDIFEYLRDSDFSLSSAIQRSFEVGDWTQQDKEDYVYLRNKFDNAKLKTFGEKLTFAKDVGIDMIADPLNVVAALMTIPSFGTSLAARSTLGAIAKQGVDKYTKGQLSKGLLQSAKKPAIYGAAEGMAWAGPHDYFNQSTDITLGERDEIDYGQVALTSGLGGVLGGTVGGTVGLISGKKYFDKALKYSDEDNLDKASKVAAKDAVDDYTIDEPFLAKGDPNKAQKFLEKAIGVTFGKSTTEFISLAKRSKSLTNLLKKFRYDFGQSMLDTGPAKLAEQSYGEAKGLMIGKYLSRLDFELEKLHRGFLGKISHDDNQALVEFLNNPKLTKFLNKKGDLVEIPDYIKEAGTNIKKLNDEMFDEGVAAGLFDKNQKVENYFPRLFNYTALKKNKTPFMELLIDSGHADPINEISKRKVKTFIVDVDGKPTKMKGIEENEVSTDMELFGKDFVEEAKKQLPNNATDTAIANKAKELKAEDIVNGMLEQRFTPFELRYPKGVGGGSAFLKSRVFTNIEQDKLIPYIETDVEKVLRSYYTNASQTITRTNFFGRTIGDFESKFITPIQKELKDAGVSDEVIINGMTNLRNLHGKVTGLSPQDSVFQNAIGQGISNWGRLFNQMAHLGLATISSISEPIILMQRAGISKSPEATKELASSLGKNLLRDIDRGIGAAYRTLGGKTRGKGISKTISEATGIEKLNISDLDDVEWRKIYQTGLALEQSVMDRIEGLTGDAITSDLAKYGQNAFFKLNLLDTWTRTVQVASFNMGKRVITDNAQELFEDAAQITKLSKSRKQFLRDQLNEIGVDPTEAVTWYRNSLNDNLQFDINKAEKTLLNGKRWYNDNVVAGANRFVKEVILNPSTAEANRPLWFSTPWGQVLMQFAGYPTVFTNTVLKRFVKDSGVRDIALGQFGRSLQTTPRTLAAAVTMTGVAVLGDYIRSKGKSLEDKKITDPEVIANAVRRWGGFGPFDYGSRFYKEVEYNQNLLTALPKAVTGPIVQDVFDEINYGSGPAGFISKNLPFSGAYDLFLGEGARREVERVGREFDEEYIQSLLSRDEKFTNFAKGGFVEGPDVPNTKEDPAEAINPATGEPYTAGTFLEDDEDV